ncbi:hypothetical protein BAE44_0018741 [Dichanthelium oligosanthes]|uniref:Uncharacterized protein n=1 Tax=Dichanthelium oligosanthes TaxID=888268 RepID=A0A1E5V504_9POAL|nr:hypothetical protein BAE44_0018741 [Dichanthelium oligosanthes]
MVSGAAGLKAAAAVAVFAVLVMSSQGHHPKRWPLCSDCQSQCSTNCSATVAAECSSDCSPPQASCDSCKSQVLQGCCQDFCKSSSGTGSNSCCPNDCIGGSCVTCSCDNCTTTVQNNCAPACNLHEDDQLRCQACRNGAAQQCFPSCLSACNDHCVKKDC